jgi:hypothetical protein
MLQYGAKLVVFSEFLLLIPLQKCVLHVILFHLQGFSWICAKQWKAAPYERARASVQSLRLPVLSETLQSRVGTVVVVEMLLPKRVHVEVYESYTQTTVEPLPISTPSD